MNIGEDHVGKIVPKVDLFQKRKINDQEFDFSKPMDSWDIAQTSKWL